MGVDIGFHIEIRRKGNWLPVVWKLPEEIMEGFHDGESEDGWIEEDAIILGRFYHFQDFLECSGVRYGLPEDITEHFKKVYNETHEKWSIGYFSLADLNSYCQRAEFDAITQMLRKRDGEIKKQLNRIEALLTHKTISEDASEEEPFEEEYEDYENTYQEYLNETCLIRKLRDNVCAIKDEMWLNDSEVRILFFPC